VLERLLLLKRIQLRPDFAKLLLRVMIFLPLFLKHGIEKLFTFGTMSQHFPDPFHLGPATTLAIAMISDGICAPLIVLGLGTRLAALYSVGNLFVAWGFVHHFAVVTRKDQGGETLFLYIAASLVVLFIGPGKYSLDALLERSLAKKGKSAEETNTRMAKA
jgi:putative oxidoreductase